MNIYIYTYAFSNNLYIPNHRIKHIKYIKYILIYIYILKDIEYHMSAEMHAFLLSSYERYTEKDNIHIHSKVHKTYQSKETYSYQEQ